MLSFLFRKRKCSSILTFSESPCPVRFGKNLLNMEFPLETESEGGTQEFLLKLRNSRLTDDALLEEFYNRVIDSYDYAENYLILLVHAAYDIPGKSTDGSEMFDASDEVYDYIMCTFCPVKLSKPGLSYHAEENSFHERIRDWIVEMPDAGFLFPAFNDRSTDIHNLLYYSKNAENLGNGLTDLLLGCVPPLTAGDQKETFRTLIEETLGDDCDYDTVKNIHENLNEMIEQNSENPEPLALDKAEVKYLLAKAVSKKKSWKHSIRSTIPLPASAVHSLPPILQASKNSRLKLRTSPFR